MDDRQYRKPLPPPQVWIFSRTDGWKPTDDPIGNQEGDDWYEAIAKAGYGHGSYAEEEGRLLHIHEAEHDTPLTRRWKFLVEVELNTDCGHFVFCPDLPSVLALVSQVGGMATAQEVERLRGIVDRFAQKSFHALHGHDLLGVCRECDPREWDATQERRRERREKRQAKKQSEAPR